MTIVIRFSKLLMSCLPVKTTMFIGELEKQIVRGGT